MFSTPAPVTSNSLFPLPRERKPWKLPLNDKDARDVVDQLRSSLKYSTEDFQRITLAFTHIAASTKASQENGKFLLPITSFSDAYQWDASRIKAIVALSKGVLNLTADETMVFIEEDFPPLKSALEAIFPIPPFPFTPIIPEPYIALTPRVKSLKSDEYLDSLKRLKKYFKDNFIVHTKNERERNSQTSNRVKLFVEEFKTFQEAQDILNESECEDGPKFIAAFFFRVEDEEGSVVSRSSKVSFSRDATPNHIYICLLPNKPKDKDGIIEVFMLRFNGRRKEKQLKDIAGLIKKFTLLPNVSFEFDEMKSSAKDEKSSTKDEKFAFKHFLIDDVPRIDLKLVSEKLNIDPDSKNALREVNIDNYEIHYEKNPKRRATELNGEDPNQILCCLLALTAELLKKVKGDQGLVDLDRWSKPTSSTDEDINATDDTTEELENRLRIGVVPKSPTSPGSHSVPMSPRSSNSSSRSTSPSSSSSSSPSSPRSSSSCSSRSSDSDRDSKTSTKDDQLKVSPNTAQAQKPKSQTKPVVIDVSILNEKLNKMLEKIENADIRIDQMYRTKNDKERVNEKRIQDLQKSFEESLSSINARVDKESKDTKSRLGNCDSYCKKFNDKSDNIATNTKNLESRVRALEGRLDDIDDSIGEIVERKVKRALRKLKEEGSVSSDITSTRESLRSTSSRR